MTLATRCPACGTAFRVVQDQLRVSQGWVRCGRCSEAFNAVESMVDVPTVLAPEPDAAGQAPAHTDFSPTAVMDWPGGGPPGAADGDPPAAASAIPAPREAPAAESVPSVPEAPATAFAEAADDGAAFVLDDTPPAAIGSGQESLLDLPLGLHLIASDGAIQVPADLPASSDDRRDPSLGLDEAAGNDMLDPGLPPNPGPENSEPFLVLAHATSAPPTAWAPAPVDDATSVPEADEPGRAPSFVVKADRAARWQRPGVRASLALLALVAGTGLAAQMTYTFRDRLAASVPASRPWLQQACERIGCRIEDFRQIEALSVESSGLVRVEGSSVYRLSVTLRNRAAAEVAAPALDLALTDAQGLQIARRVLSMADLYLPLRTLKAGSELPIQVPLNIGERPVSGYTVEIFYP